MRGGAWLIGSALLLVACGDEGGGAAPAPPRAVGGVDAAPDADPVRVWDAGPPDDADAGCRSPGIGSVIGQVCAPNGRIWLVGATVSITWTDPCTGEEHVVEASTDADGAFRLDGVAAGYRVLRIRRGSFSGDRGVQVPEGETVDLSAGDRKTCLTAGETRLAVVTGRYDRVQEILGDLGLTFDLVDGVDDVAAAEALLTNPERLGAYDILFLNCGIDKDAFARYPDVVAGLRRFVAEGGSLYVSDYSYFFFEDAFPEAVDFYGDDTDWEAGPRMGGAPQEVEARILTDELRAFMGADTLPVVFPEDEEVRTAHWVVAEGIGPGVTPLLEADDVRLCASPRSCIPGDTLPSAPLLVSHQPAPGAGVVVFTSFHQEVNLTEAIRRVLFYLVFML